MVHLELFHACTESLRKLTSSILTFNAVLGGGAGFLETDGLAGVTGFEDF